MQPHRPSLRLRAVVAFAASATLLAPLGAMAGSAPCSCGAKSSSAHLDSSCCADASSCAFSSGGCQCGGCAVTTSSSLGCMLGSCGDGCGCTTRSTPPVPLREGNDRQAPRIDDGAGAFAPLLLAIAAPLGDEQTYLEAVSPAWSPPGGRLRWHAFLSVWRN